MPDRNKSSEVKLEQLLELKKHERPSSEFWESFEKSFERRRLNALVEKPTFSERWIRPLIKLLGVAVPACTALAFYFAYQVDSGNASHRDGISRQAMAMSLTSNDYEEATQSSGSSSAAPDLQIMTAGIPRFVTDAFSNRNSESKHFRKVLYTPSLKSNTGQSAVYVEDPLSNAKEYQISAASYSPGRNF